MRGVIFLIIVFMPVWGFTQASWVNNKPYSQTEQYLNLFLQTNVSSYSGVEVNGFISKLEGKKLSFKRDKDFLHYLFYKTHRKFLKRYAEYCPFDALLKNGTYNCLTGTALYALLLDHFNFEYSVIETNYHIFLMVKTSDDDEVLFEATDPLDGFVDSNQEIQARINIYKQNKILKNSDDKMYYRYNFDLYNTVSMEELLGLMYFNLSVDAYNNHDVSKSINYLDQSVKLYQSARIKNFARIILLTVAKQDLSTIEKETCLKKIQLLQKKMPGLASAN